ncbi:unnamed protein product [Pseudo-nitzschia multistriata]|uniref:Sulfotransferase domain-containing protein n=1 Tax=Pseudo-nitzschia multistriata TaxID=183589 RepID=A0A448ZQX3_9STRA|nr:unnamed protein product [Pseudo-nitzschia multistriata]
MNREGPARPEAAAPPSAGDTRLALPPGHRWRPPGEERGTRRRGPSVSQPGHSGPGRRAFPDKAADPSAPLGIASTDGGSRIGTRTTETTRTPNTNQNRRRRRRPIPGGSFSGPGRPAAPGGHQPPGSRPRRARVVWAGIAACLATAYGFLALATFRLLALRPWEPRHRRPRAGTDRGVRHGGLPTAAHVSFGANTDARNATIRHPPTSTKTVRFRRRYPRMIYFLHIHKSGGTFVCQQAFRNRLSANYERNCNARADGRCCSGTDVPGERGPTSGEPPSFSAASQAAFAEKAPYDLVAAERELPGVLLPEHYDYVVGLRDSRDRYQSHWNHLVRERRDAGSSNTNSSNNNSNNFAEWIKGQPDNYNVRMICGTRCSAVPKYGITLELFRHALDRLWEDVSHVLFVEDMEESFGRFAEAYGWEPYDPPDPGPSPRTAGANGSAWDPYMFVLDDALYEFAKQKQADTRNATGQNGRRNATGVPGARGSWRRPFRNQALVDGYFREGPSRNCTNACCGRCSEW